MIPHIKIEDFDYELPEGRIARYPLAGRDESKLLRYRDGLVDEFVFRDLPDLLPPDSLMVFNDTKVVPARMHFRRDTGAVIEIFLLEPRRPAEYDSNFAATARCVWKCVIGNLKRWKGDVLTAVNPAGDRTVLELDLRAELEDRDGQTGNVIFTWKGGKSFSEVLSICGRIPIPPYLHRDTEDIDLERYQTAYARVQGSVAAPTAGLHFTHDVLGRLRERGVEEARVCLHVGAGTFLPVKSSEISGHTMHREPFTVSLGLLRKLISADRPVVSVGTTSVRTLESLYYAGVDCIEKGVPSDIDQWAPYTRDYIYSTEEALQSLADYLEREGLQELKLGTRIIIVPGFRFRIVQYLITNFHQPQSTLLLLISAFVGGGWRTIYDYALAHGFRFLSYGDSSLLYRK